MDYRFTATPATFSADLAAQNYPAALAAAVEAVWAATVQSDPSYEVNAAVGDLWTVVRIAAVRER